MTRDRGPGRLKPRWESTLQVCEVSSHDCTFFPLLLFLEISLNSCSSLSSTQQLTKTDTRCLRFCITFYTQYFHCLKKKTKTNFGSQQGLCFAAAQGGEDLFVGFSIVTLVSPFGTITSPPHTPHPVFWQDLRHANHTLVNSNFAYFE